MTLDELPSWALDLLAEARVGRLGYLDREGRPRVLPVTFALHERCLWSAIDQKPKRPGIEPARVRSLRERPEAALTVDRYDDDWSRLAWVQALGRVAVIDVEEHPDALDALAARYPQYRAHPPPGPLLRFEPGRALCWRWAGGQAGDSSGER